MDNNVYSGWLWRRQGSSQCSSWGLNCTDSESLFQTSREDRTLNLMSPPHYLIQWGNPEMSPPPHLGRKTLTLVPDTRFLKDFHCPWPQTFPCCWHLNLIVLLLVSKVNKAVQGKCLDLEIPVCFKSGLMAGIVSTSLHFLLKGCGQPSGVGSPKPCPRGNFQKKKKWSLEYNQFFLPQEFHLEDMLKIVPQLKAQNPKRQERRGDDGQVRRVEGRTNSSG